MTQELAIWDQFGTGPYQTADRARRQRRRVSPVRPGLQADGA